MPVCNMNFVLRVAVVDPQDASRKEIVHALSGLDFVWIEGECRSYDEFAEFVNSAHPAVGVVCLDADPVKSLEVLANLRRESPACHLCAVSRSNDGQFILRAMRAGAKEFLTLPLAPEDLATALRNLGGDSDESGQPLRGCTTIAVCGATGGVGTTTVAVNLASILASDPTKTVVLVDLDLTLGDADVFLDAVHDYTLFDVAQNVSRLDFDLLRRSLTKLDSGLYLLPRPVALAEARLIGDGMLRRVLGLLKASFSHLILDVSKGFNALDLVALESCDAALLVSQLDLPCLRNVVRLLKSFDAVPGLRDKVRIVINRTGQEEGPIRLKKVQEIMGRDIFWQIPSDYRLMVQACNNGKPLIQLAPKAEITRALCDMARALCAEKPADDGPAATKTATAPGLAKWLSFWPSSSGAAAK